MTNSLALRFVGCLVVIVSANLGARGGVRDSHGARATTHDDAGDHARAEGTHSAEDEHAEEHGGQESGHGHGPHSVDDDAPVTDEELRQRMVVVGIWALIGITLVGLTLVILTILLGRHTRRTAGQPLPERTPDDPFWHLKGRRQRASEELVGEGVGDETELDENPEDDDADGFRDP